MSEILFAPEMILLRRALLLAVLASPVLGVVGSLVVTRRISSLAGASAHTALGGVGLALYLQRVWGLTWCNGALGALAGAVAAAIVVGMVNIYAKEREDTVIGVVWALGMSIGLLFLDRTPGYVDWQGYLFGNILLIPESELWLTALLDAVVLVLIWCFYNRILAMSFDATFARLRGICINCLYLMVLILTALTVVMLIRIVGIILVIALLTLPAATSGALTRHLWSMMTLGAVLSWIFITGGLLLSYFLDLPSGPAVVVLASAGYLLVLLWKKLHPQD